ncbi:MAG TPA: hypothetical protein VIO15_10335 [Bacteroidales bacterium]
MNRNKKIQAIREALQPKEPNYISIWIVPCALKTKDLGILGTVEAYEPTGEPNILYAKVENFENRDIFVKSDVEAAKMLQFYTNLK